MSFFPDPHLFPIYTPKKIRHTAVLRAADVVMRVDIPYLFAGVDAAYGNIPHNPFFAVVGPIN
ncbi:unnamed protein product [Periconia digitata]|uniref:Uncharacterized protein n=1 Tax=Periconia digitata TaxID=1303443 RepID=A0A9W4XT23_9PLEO|nr:unnamed protein product [Periconia digitata]